MATTRGYGVFSRIATEPVEAIVAAIAIVFFLLGLYLGSPFYMPEGSQAITNTFGVGFSLERAAFAFIVYVLPSLPVILGFWYRKFYTPPWISAATLGMFIATLFSILLRIIAVGVLPITWVPFVPISFALFVAYCYFKVQRA